jgi:uncharacterized SAM-binding protein YcdF (DUF218 family)
MRRRRWWPRVALTCLLLAALSAWPLSRAGTALVVSHPLDSPDAIVMLASHEWERLPATAALARQYPQARVLLTVPRVVSAVNCHRCPERPAWLQAEGVEAERITLLPWSVGNTYEEARATRQYAETSSVSRLLVVTSPYHTRRAWGTFQSVFAGAAVQLGISPAAGANGRPERWWTAGYDRSYVIYEWTALLKYRFVHRVRA